MASKIWTKTLKLCGVIDVAALSASNFILSLFVIRELGDSNYAIYMNIFSMLMLLSTLQNAFLNTTLSVKYAKINVHKTKLNKASSLCYVANVVYLIFLVPVIFLMFKLNIFLVISVYLAFVFYLSRELFRIYNYVFDRRKLIVISALISFMVTLLGLIAPILVDFKVVKLSYIYSVIALSGVIGLIILIYRCKFTVPSAAEIKSTLNDIVDVGRWSSVGSLATWAQNNSYTYLATLIVGLEATAALAVSRLIIMPINLVASGIYMAEKPQWAKLFSIDKKQLRDKSKKTTAIMIVFVLCYLSLVLIALPLIEALLKVTINLWILLTWFLACLIQSFKFSNSNILIVSEDFKYMALMGVEVSFLGVLLSTLLGFYFEAIGIVIGFVLGELLHVFNTQVRIKNTVF
ncbi:hypothetical protein [Pseudoalteromonas sp. Angola-4]|uniref:hypothetical protein n=1 Tax=Pseudoalteromonas sp. Angola-4 TaxID=3025335 RepID=UPI0023596BE7|nr:hypothetical protein [Pseudoalteromonas sp. Angola-4]MDC9511377.1 hypothetical protein [Pseudoalteromonas sp. Angola-4]